MQIPALGPEVPRQGNRLTAAAGRLVMRAGGWRIDGSYPDVPRCVIIVAPHTSNWDFLWGVGVKLALGLRVRFLAKHTLFRGPADPVLRWLGGIPVDRRAPMGVVEQSVAAFRERPRLHLVITPEGTRRWVPAWKSGFYRIAAGADVPIFQVAIDYRERAFVFGPLFDPTGSYEADLPRIQAFFTAEMARRPGQYGA